MAKTYYAEGRQLTHMLRGLIVVGGFVLYMYNPGLHWGYFIGIVAVAVVLPEIAGALWTGKRRAAAGTGTKGKQAARKKAKNGQSGVARKPSHVRRADDIILASRLSDLSGAEFERLLALYFRDKGYTVKEVGVGGSDGGVDLVITDKRGEKTAVQAKCYSARHMVPVQTVRELVGAKRNHDCILSLLVTTSDLTVPAKKEAEQFKVDYWHGALVEQKLRAWGKWQPGAKRRSKASVATASAVAANKAAAAVRTKGTICKCGSPMVRRKNGQGVEFLGCSQFPKCRHTRAI